MTVLDRFRAEPVPRTIELCEPYVVRFVPMFGIVMWGIVYAFFSPLPPIVVGFAIAPLVNKLAPGPGPASVGVLVVLSVLIVGAFFAGWIPFVLWARRWRASRRRLLREGIVLEARFVKLAHERNEVGISTVYYYRFVHGGTARTTSTGRIGEFHDEPPEPVWVLYHPDYSFGAQFCDGEIHYRIGWGRDLQPDPD